MSLSKPYTPQPVTDLQMVFPVGVTDLMPEYDVIPEDFRRDRGDARRWIRFQRDWFFRGLPAGTKFVAKPGIDAAEAVRHLKTIQGSWDPKHEHKEAAVAYLASLWFIDPAVTG